MLELVTQFMDFTQPSATYVSVVYILCLIRGLEKEFETTISQSSCCSVFLVQV